MPTLWYEVAPPKVVGSTPLKLEKSLTLLHSKVDSLRSVVDRILVTSSVLGTPRLPSVFTAAHIKREMHDLWVGCSIRTSDYPLHQVLKVVSEALTYHLDGVLLVYGDQPHYGCSYKNYPSPLLRKLRHFIQLGEVPKMYLSAPTYRNEKEIIKKIESKPDGFITQIVTEADQILWLRDLCRSNNIELVATLLAPTPKNLASAEKIGLRWQPDETKTIHLAQTLFREGVDVSLTSPWSFKDGLEFARRLRLYK